MTKADIIASVQFYSQAEGGRVSATPTNHLGCIFEYEGENFECRLLLEDIGPVAPGVEAVIPIRFLRPDLVKHRLHVGSHFKLREMKPIGEGVIQTVAE
jgi:hypothetical protein